MATKDENVLDEGVEKESVSRRRLSCYRERTLHRLYVRGTEAVRDPWTWDCAYIRSIHPGPGCSKFD